MAYNNNQKAIALFTIAGGAITLTEALNFSYLTGENTYTVTFSAGNYDLGTIKTVINNATAPLRALDFGENALLFECASSVQFLTAFGNIKVNQVVNFIPLQGVNSFIIDGVFPDEKQIKAFPAIVIGLDTITPSPDSIMCNYSVNLTVGVTSAINTSQVDYLSNQLMKYYDCIQDVLMVQDNGSLGGIVNGVNILSADIGEAAGNSYFLKYLTITLEISVEED